MNKLWYDENNPHLLTPYGVTCMAGIGHDISKLHQIENAVEASLLNISDMIYEFLNKHQTTLSNLTLYTNAADFLVDEIPM